LADEKSSVVHNYRDFAAQVSLSPHRCMSATTCHF
jgi:hypothetical protein